MVIFNSYVSLPEGKELNEKNRSLGLPSSIRRQVLGGRDGASGYD
jgi:hypothetical protein